MTVEFHSLILEGTTAVDSTDQTIVYGNVVIQLYS